VHPSPQAAIQGRAVNLCTEMGSMMDWEDLFLREQYSAADHRRGGLRRTAALRNATRGAQRPGPMPVAGIVFDLGKISRHLQTLADILAQQCNQSGRLSKLVSKRGILGRRVEEAHAGSSATVTRSWTIICAICGAQRGEGCYSLVTHRELPEGHTLRIWSQQEWDERHPE